MGVRLLTSVSECSKCGLCKGVCPILRVTKEESKGPRCRVLQINEKAEDFTLIYSTLCSACDAACPVGIEISKDILAARERLVSKGIETPANKKMIENIRKYGNPFGKIEGKPKELFCC